MDEKLRRFLKKWDERLMRADDGLGFRKNWGRTLVEVLGVFFTILRGGVCGSVLARVFSSMLLTL